MAKTVEQRTMDGFVNGVSDMRFNEASFSALLNDYPYSVQERMLDTVTMMVKFWYINGQYGRASPRCTQVSNAWMRSLM